jgi:uncharacterized membrane protein
MPRTAVRARRLWRSAVDSLWLVPLVYICASLALVILLVNWDHDDPIVLTESLSAASASAALSALGSGMLAFTGFVTSIVLLIVQFGSSEFSPRLLRWFRRDRTLQFALSTFIATFLFAIVATAEVGRGSADFVPSRTVLGALALRLLSIVMFLLLIARTANGLRVARATQRVDAVARHVFDAVYSASAADVASAEQARLDLRTQPPVQVLHNREVGAVLVALDHRGLVALAGRADAVIELVHAVGDHIPADEPVLNVYGPTPLPEKSLRHAIVMGDERTLDDDPAFALRVLVDIAIKALSTAVNDPTTATQCLDRIEDLLRYASDKNLSIGTVSDATGALRLVYPTPTWADLVELGLSEIRVFGARQYQTARRLRALLVALLEDVPERRRPALEEQLTLLDDAVAASFRDTQRAPALVADRQGIGMAGRTAVPGGPPA